MLKSESGFALFTTLNLYLRRGTFRGESEARQEALEGGARVLTEVLGF